MTRPYQTNVRRVQNDMRKNATARSKVRAALQLAELQEEHIYHDPDPEQPMTHFMCFACAQSVKDRHMVPVYMSEVKFAEYQAEHHPRCSWVASAVALRTQLAAKMADQGPTAPATVTPPAKPSPAWQKLMRQMC